MANRSPWLLAAAALLANTAGLMAQQQPPAQGRPGTALPSEAGAVVSTAPAAVGGCCPTPQKVCVSEPVARTKVCYAVKCEEYCLPKCSLLSILRGGCGCDGHCGDVRTRNVLVKKKVPDCDGFKCVVKE